MKKLFLICLPLLMFFQVRADIAIEGEVDHKFQIVNINEFSDFEFYINYKEYTYDYGYQLSGETKIVLEADREYLAGDRGSRSQLFAEHKESGEEFASNEMLGGEEIISDYDVRYILDYIEIQSVEAETVNFKVVKSEYVYRDGKKRKVRKGMIGIGGPWFLIVAVIAAVLLAAFFFLRKKGEHEL